MIMQGYDFVELHRRYGTVLQMGGSDQWGNIINGVDLGHRMLGSQFYAVTTPLLTKASGEKMGKSASGAVWLNDELFSPYDFWQYFRNAEDADVGKWLKVFTRLPLDEIARLGALGGSELNEAKKILATEVTAIVHGREAAETAAETARATFESGAIDLSLPSVDVPKSDLASGLGLQAALVLAGLATSNGEARRHIASGAVRVNDTVVNDERSTIGVGDFLPEGVIKLSVGKKRHALVKPV
jgi:tyrosyl-tRNA synthetase